MASFLTIPLYKIVCNLSYLDDLPSGIIDATELIYYDSDCLGNTVFLERNDYVSMCINVISGINSVVVQSLNLGSYEVCMNVSFNEEILESSQELGENVAITFLSKVSSVTLLEFVTLQETVWLNAGEPVLVFFRIYNPTGVDLTGISMYFVYPGNMALFVTKIQCFCFDLIQIKAKETVELPVLFYMDASLLIDYAALSSTIYVSYVFFIQ